MELLLLTKFYPYGTGESFIENEIKILSEYYTKVRIIACEVPKTEERVRPLPKNVECFKVPTGNKLIDILHGLILLFTKKDALQHEKMKTSTIIQKTFLGYFEAKSQRVYDAIQTQGMLSGIEAESYVLYSYWLFMTARVGTLISTFCPPVYKFSRAHRYDLYEEKNKAGYLPYRELFLNSYNNIFPCSDDGTLYLKTKYPLWSDNVRTGFLGTIDHGIGRGSSDGIYRIVSCSRTEPLKRVSAIVEALHLLDESGRKIEWTHVGAGSEFERIKKRAEEQLKNIKHNFTGNLNNSDVMKLYKEQPFDLFINVSNSEGLPVSIMEAISFGIPCIGTDVGGTCEIVVDGITGKLLPCEFAISDLATVIEQFVDNEENFVTRESCRTYWENHFQAITNYHALCDFVESQYGKR